MLTDGPGIFERARLRAPGDIDRRESWWKRVLGLEPSDAEALKRGARVIRYDDESGIAQGFALYEVVLDNGDYPARADVADLVAATDDAYAALWRYLIELDLVSTVKATLRGVTEQLSWQVSDRRAVKKTDERDHLWLRIIDVASVVVARTYSCPGSFVLQVTDELGFADGDYLLTIAPRGVATAVRLTGSSAPPPEAAARVRLSVAELGAIYLGGTSASELARAGRIEETTANAAALLDAAFHWPVPPRLSIWF